MHIDIRIAHFVAGSAVADDKKKSVLGGSVDEPMSIVPAGRKACAHARTQHLYTGVGFEFDLALQDVDEFVLS